MNAESSVLGVHSINLKWLVKLRWGAIVGQLVAVLTVHFAMGISLRLMPLFGVMFVHTVSNAIVAAWLRHKPRVKESYIALIMGFDLLSLTALLYFTGGPFNPFTVIYLVHIAMSAAVLSAGFTWALVGFSLLCFGGLYMDSTYLSEGQSHAHHMQNMRLHLEGMWVGFFVAATFIGYFVTRVRSALAAREQDLHDTRAMAARGEQLASLATLAAGAAHELATPLGTIAVASKDLELGFRQRHLEEPEILEDVLLIRQEVQRCRGILDKMASDAGETIGEQFSTLPVGSFFEGCLSGLPRASQIKVQGESEVLDAKMEGPLHGVEQALRAILKNALDASTAEAPIQLQATLEEHPNANTLELKIRVVDEGMGMSDKELARLGEPFFTTKEVGVGMGLGVFLARAVLLRVGGNLRFTSTPGEGTCAFFDLPLRCVPQESFLDVSQTTQKQL
ncbi:MAG: HAMP domain-containing histidine kinase [Deltaproteobacteria bacterium]|nr:HAMP domain-containing histidine kinase [Deltaproteobacteria bacterium]